MSLFWFGMSYLKCLFCAGTRKLGTAKVLCFRRKKREYTKFSFAHKALKTFPLTSGFDLLSQFLFVKHIL